MMGKAICKWLELSFKADKSKTFNKVLITAFQQMKQAIKVN